MSETVVEKQRIPLRLRNILIVEAFCRCGCLLRPSDMILVSAQALAYRIERKLGYPVLLEISSMARCPKHNADEGGVPDSRHTVKETPEGIVEDGRPDAIDFRVKIFKNGAWEYLDSSFVAEEAIHSGLFGGVGHVRYLRSWTDKAGKVHDASLIVHADCRPGRLTIW